VRWAPLGGVACLAVWMIHVETPRVLAQPHWERYLALALDADSREDELAEDADLELLEQKLTALTKAAKADPRDARIQLRTAQGYLALFHKRQLLSPNRMSLLQIRDAALQSRFESKEQLRDWLGRAFGENGRLLQAALSHTRRAVRLNPLEGRAYLQLARLEFLEGTDHDATAEYVQQAEAVRPYDPQVLFAAGREAWLARQYPAAIDKWKQAFDRHESYRQQIIELMAMYVPAQDFIETFGPDSGALKLLADRYQALGRRPDYELAQGRYAQGLRQRAENLENREAVRTLLDAARAFDQLGRTDDAEQCLRAALAHDPNSFNVHYVYGAWAVGRQQWEQAAEHLAWCSKQRPSDRPLRKLAEEALERKLQVAGRPQL
jgi:cytochrome c-type biogenesis protein CcmH/NrfG